MQPVMRLQHLALSRGVARSLTGSGATGMRVTRALQPPQIALARSPPIYEMASTDYQPSTKNFPAMRILIVSAGAVADMLQNQS